MIGLTGFLPAPQLTVAFVVVNRRWVDRSTSLILCCLLLGTVWPAVPATPLPQ
jgi:hypothetical protein